MILPGSQVFSQSIIPLKSNGVDLVENGYDWNINGMKYYKIPNVPVDQYSPIEFKAHVKNVGANTALNAALSLNVNSFVGIAQGDAKNISGTSADSLFLEFTSPSIGVLDMELSVVSDCTDLDISNNAFGTETIEYGGHIYQRDDGVIQGGASFPTEPMLEVGNYFEIFEDVQLQGIDVVVHYNNIDGTPIYAAVYEETNFGVSLLAMTDFYVLTQDNIDNEETVTIALEPINLEAGKKYIAVIGSYENFVFAYANPATPITSFISFEGMAASIYYINDVPMIRMNFDPSIGIQENQLLSSRVYPNPAVDFLNIETVLVNPDLTILNELGQIVHQSTISGTSTQVPIFDFPQGFYFVELASGNERDYLKVVID